MSSASHRPFTPARIFALLAIAIVAAGLVALRASSGDGDLAVPPGAAAGDLVLESCAYPTEEGPLDADCGVLVVPEDRSDPDSSLIALRVTRIPARSGQETEPVFFLTGGPGQSNMELDIAGRYAEDRDFVMVGYRGIDGSVRLDCPEVSAAYRRSPDLLDSEWFRDLGGAFGDCADRLEADGIDVTLYGIPQQIDDMEAARKALGYERINLLSESTGTRTALVYSWRYPDSVHRSVMLGANPPGAFLWDADTTDAQIDRYAEYCGRDATCRTRTTDLAASIRDVAADMPARWWFLPIKGGNVLVASFFGLFDSTPAGSPTPAPTTIDAWLSAAEGDPSGLWFNSVFGDLFLPDLFTWGQWAAVGMLDGEASREYFSSGDVGVNLGRAATTSGWAGGLLADSWPATAGSSDYLQMRTSGTETLIVSGELDPSTPPQIASKQLLPHLSRGREVVLPGFGHTGTLLREQPEANARLINTFYATGQVDTSLYRAADIDFTPPLTFETIAKLVVGAMVAFAALAIASLWAMARRVKTRSRIGPVSASLLRSVYLVLLGFGGWSVASLVVLATMPRARIDNMLVTVLSVALPVAGGVFLAWVHREWKGHFRQVGFAATVGCAIVGAWLGFHAAASPLAIVTAIVGAAVGANLALLALDVIWDQGGRLRFGPARTSATPALEKART